MPLNVVLEMSWSVCCPVKAFRAPIIPRQRGANSNMMSTMSKNKEWNSQINKPVRKDTDTHKDVHPQERHVCLSHRVGIHDISLCFDMVSELHLKKGFFKRQMAKVRWCKQRQIPILYFVQFCTILCLYLYMYIQVCFILFHTFLNYIVYFFHIVIVFCFF